jgi:hypothetical protein
MMEHVYYACSGGYLGPENGTVCTAVSCCAERFHSMHMQCNCDLGMSFRRSY